MDIIVSSATIGIWGSILCLCIIMFLGFPFIVNKKLNQYIYNIKNKKLIKAAKVFKIFVIIILSLPVIAIILFSVFTITNSIL